MTEHAHELIAFGPVDEDARAQIDRCLEAGGEEARRRPRRFSLERRSPMITSPR